VRDGTLHRGTIVVLRGSRSRVTTRWRRYWRSICIVLSR